MPTPILDILWIIPLLPLLGAAINGLFGKNWPNKIVNTVALSATGLSFVAALEAVREFFEQGQKLVRIYSPGYLTHEGGYSRFFSYLHLFMFFMLILVLAATYVLLFVGWEGVGLACYLLIGFYFLRKSASD